MVALFYLAVPRILASFNLVYTGVAAVAVAVVYYFLARWGLRDMQKRGKAQVFGQEDEQGVKFF